MACTSALWRLLAGCGRRYLRLLPAAERAALRHSWVLEQLERLTLTLTLTLTLILTLTLTLTLTYQSVEDALVAAGVPFRLTEFDSVV